MHVLDRVSDRQINGRHRQHPLIQVQRFKPLLYQRYLGCICVLRTQLTKRTQVLTLFDFPISAMVGGRLLNGSKIVDQVELLYI